MQSRYEKHHRCIYSEEAVEAAVRLSARYIADRQLPDKAIDLLDEAGSRVRVQAYMARKAGVDSPDTVMSWRELQQVLDAKAEALQVCPPRGRGVYRPISS
jgi:ATP-dependent Clp protease ATP-binding subunit ClpC